MNPDDRSARILAEHGGYEIVEVDGRVWFFDRRTSGPILAAAISGGVAAITLVNGLLLATSLLTGGQLGATWLAVAIVLAISALAVAVCSFSLKLRQTRAERPRAELRPLAIADRRAGLLLDGDGRTLAPLASVRAERGLVLTSSAPAVVLRPPQGSRIEVFRGTLVGGGVDQALQALAGVGFAR